MSILGLDSDIDRAVSEFHSDLDPGARAALAELVKTVCEKGAADPSVPQALRDYFSAMGAPGLGSDPLISLAVGFLDRPSSIASTEFYANGRRQLDDAQYRDFQRCVLDRLFQECWPSRRGHGLEQDGSESSVEPAPRQVEFGESDYHRVLLNHLGRDRNYAIDSDTLLKLLSTIRRDLSEAMQAAGLPPQRQAEVLDHFEVGVGREIRQLLNQVEAGTAPSGLVHFVV